MNFCLSDLVPPLRWSDAARITTLTDRPGLPDAWWRTLPMYRVLAVLDAEALGELLTELALDHWPAAAVGDVLPALHVLDPDEADDPQVAIALDRVGSWHGLLALSGRELADQPFIKARPVLTALFTAVFLRMSPDDAFSGEERGDPVGDPLPDAHDADEPTLDEMLPDAAPDVVSDIPELIDAAFADLDDQTWMVAQNRVFTDEPSAPDQLAKLLAVAPAVIHDLEATLRDRLARWLTLPEAAPYNEHLAMLTATLGAAIPKARLVTAADWHRRELRSLEVPAWRFVLATLPGYRLYGDWLVAGDIEELRARTRDLIASAERPPTVPQALEMVSSLGIRPDVAREWLESVPQLRAQKASQINASQINAERTRDRQPGGPQDRRQGLKDVALTRRCFRQPDGRWWLRVDVSGDHLHGSEVPLPTGFAAYVGLAPGEERTVRSAVGEVGLSWHSRPMLGSLQRLLSEVSAEEGSHIFLTLSEEGMLRVRHLPAADGGDDTSRALRLVGYTAPSGTPEQATRVIASRVGLTGPVERPELLARLRERGDRDLLALLG